MHLLPHAVEDAGWGALGVFALGLALWCWPSVGRASARKDAQLGDWRRAPRPALPRPRGRRRDRGERGRRAGGRERTRTRTRARASHASRSQHPRGERGRAPADPRGARALVARRAPHRAPRGLERHRPDLRRDRPRLRRRSPPARRASYTLIGYVQALVAGMLIHVLFHRHDHGHDHDHDHDHDHGHDHDHDHDPTTRHPRPIRYHDRHGDSACTLLKRAAGPGSLSLTQAAAARTSPLMLRARGDRHARVAGERRRAGRRALRAARAIARPGPRVCGDRSAAGVVHAPAGPRAGERAGAGSWGLCWPASAPSFCPTRQCAGCGAGHPSSSEARGMLFGQKLPVCSCGVVPMYRSQHRARRLADGGIAFLVATPELGIEALIISVPFLGWELTIASLVAAALVALYRRVVGRTEGQRPRGGRARRGTRATIGPHLEPPPRRAVLFALWTSSTTSRRGSSSGRARQHWWTRRAPRAGGARPSRQEPRIAFALLGLPVYVCASGATPMAAAMLAVGVSPGAVLAFPRGPRDERHHVGVLTSCTVKKIAWNVLASRSTS